MYCVFGVHSNPSTYLHTLIHVLYYTYMWQSQVEIEDYFVVYFN